MGGGADLVVHADDFLRLLAIHDRLVPLVQDVGCFRLSPGGSASFFVATQRSAKEFLEQSGRG